MNNSANVVLFGLLFLLYAQNDISLTQLLLLLALMSTNAWTCNKTNAAT